MLRTVVILLFLFAGAAAHAAPPTYWCYPPPFGNGVNPRYTHDALGARITWWCADSDDIGDGRTKGLDHWLQIAVGLPGSTPTDWPNAVDCGNPASSTPASMLSLCAKARDEAHTYLPPPRWVSHGTWRGELKAHKAVLYLAAAQSTPAVNWQKQVAYGDPGKRCYCGQWHVWTTPPGATGASLWCDSGYRDASGARLIAQCRKPSSQELLQN